MLKRVSDVDYIFLNSLSSASHFQIGDAKEVDFRTDVFALLRDNEVWFGTEGDLDKFSIFGQPVVLPALYEPLIQKTRNLNGTIKVGNVNILGVVSSALIQIGSNEQLHLETRVKHIRHLTIPPGEDIEEAIWTNNES